MYQTNQKNYKIVKHQGHFFNQEIGTGKDFFSLCQVPWYSRWNAGTSMLPTDSGREWSYFSAPEG